MDKKTTGIVAYITWVGLLVAYFAGDKEGAKFHINQALTIWLAGLLVPVVTFVLGLLSAIPVIGFVFAIVAGLFSTVAGIFLFACVIIALIGACKDEEKEVPLLGKIKILK